MYATRQNFIALVSLLAFLAFAATNGMAQTTPTLRVGLVTRIDPASRAAFVSRGVQLGAAEAKQTAKLFGGDVLLFEELASGTSEAAAARLLSRRKVQVLIGASAEDADALSRFAETNGLLFFNAASRSSALRAACRRHTFHIEASDAMYASAARLAVERDTAAAATVLWAGSLEKYGASQINDRFRNRFHLPMDGRAWAGWVAVKIAAEAALRAKSTRPSALLAYLEAPSTSFDGHKGWPLSFRRADHQLRQPLYVSARGARSAAPGVKDVPQLNALSASGAEASQLLDQLMPSTGNCVWSSK